MTEESKYYIGFAIDGVVQQFLITDSRFAAILLSDPEIIDLTNNPEIEKHEKGHTWSTALSKWIPLQPYPSWTLNEDQTKWVAPVPIPPEGSWFWIEEDQNWREIPQDAIPQ